MNVFIVYRQKHKTGRFWWKRWSPKEVTTVYGDEAEARNAVDQWNKEYPNRLYTVELWYVTCNYGLRKQQLLDFLSCEGKELLGLLDDYTGPHGGER